MFKLEEQKLDLILNELAEIRKVMATKDDVADINFIKQAVIEINQDVKQILEDQKSIQGILGEH